MRHLFDQYKEPENRLTHALVWCLRKDRRLLRSFIRKFLEGKFLRSIKIRGEFMHNLLGLGKERFEGLAKRVSEDVKRVLPKRAQPYIVMLQRHGAHHRLEFVDAKIECDITSKKYHPQWMEAIFHAFKDKKKIGSNLEFAIGAEFPYGKCEALKKEEIIDTFAKVCLACKPFWDATVNPPK